MTPVLAASQQQRIAIAVVVITALGWVVYLLSTAKRTYEPGSELEVAPNRKGYFEDESLEGPRLTRFLWWAFVMLAICAVGLPLYWLREPFRQEGAGFDRGTAYFENKAVQRGHELYQESPGNPPTPREPHFGCERCHGVGGIGGVADYTFTDPSNPEAPPKTVKWAAPPLNTVMLRFRPEEVKTIIIYGRDGTPMPPWGEEGGGPMNDQQINDLIAYLEEIALDPDVVRQDALEEYGTDGRALFDAYCARCHTQGFSYGEPGPPGAGAFGPALTNGATLRQFPAVEQHLEWVGKTAEFGKQYGQRGIAKGVMPFFENSLAPEQIQAIVDYERTL